MNQLELKSKWSNRTKWLKRIVVQSSSDTTAGLVGKSVCRSAEVPGWQDGSPWEEKDDVKNLNAQCFNTADAAWEERRPIVELHYLALLTLVAGHGGISPSDFHLPFIERAEPLWERPAACSPINNQSLSQHPWDTSGKCTGTRGVLQVDKMTSWKPLT